MNLNEWAIRWGIPAEALEDLRRQMGAVNTDAPVSDALSETGVQSRVRLEASRRGMRLWRNNVGACYTDEGQFIRYGLANDSHQMNKRIKSSDLVGLRPVLIEPHHVGQVIGQFVARECKPEGWRYTGTEHEQAQLKFLELVLSLGGDAAFANREGTL
jgi:hypothetical protein